MSAVGLSRPDASALTVVTFHRVLPAALRDAYPIPELVVTPDELSWFLEQMSQSHVCGTLGAMHDGWLQSSSKRPRLALTFDDGQLDNFLHARPVLDAAALKATFFVVPQAIDAGVPLWHDRVAYAAVASGRDVGSLMDEIRALSEGERDAAVEQLQRDVGSSVPEWDGLMDWSQLQALVRDGHEVGSHTMAHALLHRCDDTRLVAEVAGSKARLETELAVPVTSFCYPNGDHDGRAVRAVAAAGYRRAVTTAWGPNAPGAYRFTLSRCDLQGQHVRNRQGRLSASRLAFRLSRVHPGPR